MKLCIAKYTIRLWLFAIILLIVGLSGCKHPIHKEFVMPNKNDAHAQCIVPDEADATITIFIHGTRLFPKFYPQELFYSPEGFKHISLLEEASHMHTIAQTLVKADPKNFNAKSFYTFGWNGNLDFYERKKAAIDLYKSIKELVKAFLIKHGKSPKIRLITHSHGGNVALNLVTVAKELQDASFCIDELILLACPVQEETKACIADPLLGRVYSLCSCNDLLQIIDPQGLYKGKEKTPLFSERYFETHPRLLQAKIKHRGRYILHIEFLKKYFYMQLPNILHAMDVWYEHVKTGAHKPVHVPWIDMFGKKVKIYPLLK
jgi:hypothetical protein